MNNVAIVGFGYWGLIIARNFYNHPTCELKYICDLNDNNLKRAEDYSILLNLILIIDLYIKMMSINIVALYTVSTHFELAMHIIS